MKKMLSASIMAFIALASVILPSVVSVPSAHAEVHPDLQFTGRQVPLGDGYKIQKIIVTDAAGKEEAGFCYNRILKYPSAQGESYGLHTYKDQNERIDGVLRVLYAGYANNKMGVKEKFNLADEDFYYITQHAVWQFTDGDPNNEGEGSGYDMEEMDRELKVSGFPEEKQQRIKNAFTELLEISQREEVPVNHDLYFYVANNGAFQNVLAARFAQDSTHNKTAVPVTKNWKGDTEATRPKEVTIKLLADGVDTGVTLTLNKENNWRGTFNNLEKFKNGKEVKYTVAEASVDNYSSEISGSAADGYEVTNTRLPEKPTEPSEPTKPEVPVTPETPAAPNKPTAPEGKGTLAKTGADTSALFFAGAVALAGAGLIALRRRTARSQA